MTKIELSDWPLHPAPKPTFVVGWATSTFGDFKLHLKVGGCTTEMEFPGGVANYYSGRCEAIRQIYAKGQELHAVDQVKKRLLS